MHLKLFLLILLVPGISLNIHAQRVIRKGATVKQVAKKEPVADYSLSQLNGKWQEIKRTPLKTKKSIEFSDTLLMRFNNGKAVLRDATSMTMTMTGVAQIDAPNSLSVAGDLYSIRSLSKTKLIIDDGENTREFQKKDQFYYETVGKIILERDSFSNPVNIDIRNLKGKWLVYSRKAEPGSVKKETAIIKSLNIVSISEDGIAFGEVVFYNTDISRSSSCQLVTKDGSIKIVSEKYTWNLNAYKLNSDEFVFGDTGGLLYYSKHL